MTLRFARPAQSCSEVGVEVLSPSSSLLFRHPLRICPTLNPPLQGSSWTPSFLTYPRSYLGRLHHPSVCHTFTCPDPGPGLGSCEGSGGDSNREQGPPSTHPVSALSPHPCPAPEQFLLQLEPTIRID